MNEQDTQATGGIAPKTKLAVIAVVILLTLAAVYLPRLLPQFTGSTEITKFQVTPDPLQAYEVALKGDQPLFVEFYAKW